MADPQAAVPPQASPSGAAASSPPPAQALPAAAAESTPAPAVAATGEPAVAAPAPVAAEPAPVSPQAPAAAEPAAPAPPEFPATAMEAGKTPAEAPKAAEATPAEAAKPAAEAAKPDAAQPAEVPAAEAAPTYAFNWPEDIKADSINQERVGSLTSILGKAKVSQEVAQELLDLHVADLRDATKTIAERLSAQSWDHFRQTTNGWHDEIKSHEVLGGARYNTAMRDIGSVIEQNLPPQMQKDLYDRLRATGMGNDVNLALLLHTLAHKTSREATPVVASEPRRAPLTRQQRGEARYNGSTAAR